MVNLNKYWLIIFISILLLYLSPYVINGQSSYIITSDNLDSNFIYYKLLVDSGKSFSDPLSPINNMMNGLPRGFYPSALNIVAFLFYLFPPFIAYVINEIIVRLVAFGGMYLLLNNYILPKNHNAFIVYGVSLCFCILPYYPLYGITISGQPLLIYAFLNLLINKNKIVSLLLIAIFPFYSSLILSGLFVILVLIMHLLYQLIYKKNFSKIYFIGIIILASVYLIVEYQLFYITYFSPIVSNRIEFYIPSITLSHSVKSAMQLFLLGQRHAASCQIIIVSLIVPLAIFIGRKTKESSYLLIIRLLTIIISISMIVGIILFIKPDFLLLRELNLERFYFLNPILWYLVFALSLSIISMKIFELTSIRNDKSEIVLKFNGNHLCMMFILLQIIFLFMQNPNYYQFHKNYIGIFTNNKEDECIEYNAFFSKNLFREIRDFIAKPVNCYKIVCIGFHPSIALYNGFFTIDGHRANYPLEYKHKFRRIIEAELDKNETWKNYYDWWGCRVYIFLAELDELQIFKWKNKRIKSMALNTSALKEMGCKYILSAVEILNYKENNLGLLNVFERRESPWRIYVYKLY